MVIVLGYRVRIASLACRTVRCGGGYSEGRTHEHEIDNTLLVRTIAEVFMVATRETGANTMVLVHHARNTIESESVKLVHFDPVP